MDVGADGSSMPCKTDHIAQITNRQQIGLPMLKLATHGTEEKECKCSS
jgi:hypothetical protein